MSLQRRFTLIELIAVVTIMGIVMLAVVPALDGMVPKYRLRSAAREVASIIEQAQAEAVGKRREYVLAYDLDENTFWLILPPQDEEEEEESGGGLFDFGGEEKEKGQRPKNDVEHGLPPVDTTGQPQDEDEQVDVLDRESLTPKELPPGVVFKSVMLGDDEKTAGTVYVPFSHLGNEGTHVVGLELGPDESQELSIFVKFSALSRTISYHDEPPQLRTLGGSN